MPNTSGLENMTPSIPAPTEARTCHQIDVSPNRIQVPVADANPIRVAMTFSITRRVRWDYASVGLARKRRQKPACSLVSMAVHEHQVCITDLRISGAGQRSARRPLHSLVMPLRLT